MTFFGSKILKASRSVLRLFCRLQTNTTSSRFSSYPIIVGTPIRKLGNNMNRVPAFTTPVGCKAPAPEPCRTLRNIPVSKLTLKVLSGLSQKISEFLAGTSGMSQITQTKEVIANWSRKTKVALILLLLPKVVDWGREAHPTQPLTSGVWKGGWSSPEKLDPMEKIQIDMSDVIAFHSYDTPEEFEKPILWLHPSTRPILSPHY